MYLSHAKTAVVEQREDAKEKTRSDECYEAPAYHSSIVARWLDQN